MNRIKLCKKCNETKDLDMFSRDVTKSSGITSSCKKCLANNAKVRRVKQSSKYKSEFLNRLYGISLNQYNEMLAQQNGLCKICNKSQRALDKNTNKNRDLVVDHDHKTGSVRGLLCFRCNTGLGNMGDSIQILNNAIQYLLNSNK